MTAPEGRAGDIADVLRALADLAPGDRAGGSDLVDITSGGDPWLALETSEGDLAAALVDGRTDVTIDADQPARRLQAFDALHEEEQVLRLGWGFLAGRVEVDARPRRVCMPLLVRPVRLRTGSRDRLVIEPAGELEVGLPIEWERAAVLETSSPLHPSTLVDPAAAPVEPHAWFDAVLLAAGLPKAELLPAGEGLTAARQRDRTGVVPTFALFIDRASRPGARAARLRRWSIVEDIDGTAFAELYQPSTPAATSTPEQSESVRSAVPLTDAQGAVVVRAREERLVCVSGAPGTGKSHLACALAADALAAGRSVLVATPTPYAADVLAGLLQRQPGPVPVVFGEADGRRAMGRDLEAAATSTATGNDVEAATPAARDGAEREQAAAEAVVAGALEREKRAARAVTRTLRLPDLRAAAPLAFEPDAALAELTATVDRAAARRAGVRGWWRGRRARRACGAPDGTTPDALVEAVDAARDVRADAELESIGGTVIGPAWDGLLEAERAARDTFGRWVDVAARHEGRWDNDARRAVAALGRALPAGRNRRRELLATIDAAALVRALPLWVGTLRDVDDLLPTRPAMFDLVIVDEGAQVDQFAAAGALLRGRAAVVVGDPRQLRHVSFVADADVAATLEDRDVTELADRLDVRRMALYDVAAGAAPVTWLDEHFRSVPHLISFSARRFYDDRVLVATRNPVNEAEDAVDVVRVEGGNEVDAAVDLISSLVAGGHRSIGAVSPFRETADALEAALVERFSPEQIVEAGLRAGTAHSFQGGERDHVVVVLGLAADDQANRWRFVEDPNLFNVLVTRARQRLTVVTALAAGTERPGIVADYLRHAETPPAPTPVAAAEPGWVERLAAELTRLDVTVRPGYGVGRWTVDLCVGTGADAVALDCVPHPAGAEAHIARHRGLRLAGWRIVDAFPSRWDGDPVQAAIDLAGEVGTPLTP